MSDPLDTMQKGWRKVSDFGPAGAAYKKGSGLRVITTEGEKGDHGDEHAWLHISVSRGDRIPNYDDLCEVKRVFAGEDAKAIMVLPAKANHVNIHPYCLHLYVCLTGDPLPEFSGHVEGIGRSI